MKTLFQRLGAILMKDNLVVRERSIAAHSATVFAQGTHCRPLIPGCLTSNVFNEDLSFPIQAVIHQSSNSSPGNRFMSICLFTKSQLLFLAPNINTSTTAEDFQIQVRFQNPCGSFLQKDVIRPQHTQTGSCKSKHTRNPTGSRALGESQM